VTPSVWSEISEYGGRSSRRESGPRIWSELSEYEGRFLGKESGPRIWSEISEYGGTSLRRESGPRISVWSDISEYGGRFLNLEYVFVYGVDFSRPQWKEKPPKYFLMLVGGILRRQWGCRFPILAPMKYQVANCDECSVPRIPSNRQTRHEGVSKMKAVTPPPHQ
jgi:hypothetical protein